MLSTFAPECVSQPSHESVYDVHLFSLACYFVGMDIGGLHVKIGTEAEIATNCCYYSMNVLVFEMPTVKALRVSRLKIMSVANAGDLAFRIIY